MFKPTRGIASPFVEVEVCGVEPQRFKTKTVPDNGFRPFWNEDCRFDVPMPELASLRFIVQDEDMFGDANTIGQNCFPLGTRSDPSIRTGEPAGEFVTSPNPLPFSHFFGLSHKLGFFNLPFTLTSSSLFTWRRLPIHSAQECLQ